MRNHRITRRRTRSVSAARLAWLIGRGGRNAGGASRTACPAGSTKTPSVTQAWRCTWRLSAEAKRCRKEMPPSRGRADAGAALVTPAAAHRLHTPPAPLLGGSIVPLGPTSGGLPILTCLLLGRDCPLALLPNAEQRQDAALRCKIIARKEQCLFSATLAGHFHQPVVLLNLI